MAQGSSGDEEYREPEIVWVGEQRLMEGYCGRAPATPTEPARQQQQEQPRPVAIVRRKPGQREFVRIGPPRAAAD